MPGTSPGMTIDTYVEAYVLNFIALGCSTGR